MPKKEEVKEAGGRFVRVVKTIGAIVGAVASVIFFLVFILFFAGFFVGGGDSIPSGNIAVVPVNGVITTTSEPYAFGTQVVSADHLKKIIQKIDERQDIKAAIFEINSPGGSPVASEEIANAIKNMKKPSVAVLRDVAASGGYWVASSAGRIFTNRMTITGSIGVTASTLEFSGFIERYNISYRRLVSGKFKDAGSVFRELTQEEREKFETLLRDIHSYFIEAVAENRNLSYEKVKELADGFIILGSEAVRKGLADEIGGREEAKKYLEQKLNITAELAEVKERRGLLDFFAESISKNFFYAGKGVGEALIEKRMGEVEVRV